MVYIFYYRSIAQLPAELFEHYFEQLPAFVQKKVASFKHWQDAERSMAGNILLLKGLQLLNIGGYALPGLKYTALQKPYFDQHLNFNISHSGAYTICAISLTNKVGIDVEEIKQIPLVDFTDFFYDEEWQRVLSSDNQLHAFYTLWTQKEAFLKVIGSGLNMPLNQVLIENNSITWKGISWLLQKVEIDPAYICHFCTNEPLPAFKITNIIL